jgi:hypothetical protein
MEMTGSLEKRDWPVVAAVEAPLVDQGLLRLGLASCAPAEEHGVVTAVTSLTDRSDLAQLAANSPQTSGQCGIFLYPQKAPEEVGRSEPTKLLVDMLVREDLRLAAIAHQSGHPPFMSGAIVMTSGNLGGFEAGYLRIVRNSMAHSIPNPREEERGEVAVKANTFLSGLYRTLEGRDENAAARMIYSNFYEFRQRQEYGLSDRIVQDVEENRLTTVLLVALLTITASMKKQLRHRTGLFERAKAKIARLRGEEAAERTLIGLE